MISSSSSSSSSTAPQRVFVGLDGEHLHLTFDEQLYQDSKVASLKEVKKYAIFSDSFLESVRTDESVKIVKLVEIIETVEGVFKVLWEVKKDQNGIEDVYLYFVDSEGVKHLIF